MITRTYNVRRIEDMSTGLTKDFYILSGYTHYLCRWNDDGTRNAVVRAYKSAKAAQRAAEKAESQLLTQGA